VLRYNLLTGWRAETILHEHVANIAPLFNWRRFFARG